MQSENRQQPNCQIFKTSKKQVISSMLSFIPSSSSSFLLLPTNGASPRCISKCIQVTGEGPNCHNYQNPKNGITNLIAIIQSFSRTEKAFSEQGKNPIANIPRIWITSLIAIIPSFSWTQHAIRRQRRSPIAKFLRTRGLDKHSRFPRPIFFLFPAAHLQWRQSEVHARGRYYRATTRSRRRRHGCRQGCHT